MAVAQDGIQVNNLSPGAVRGEETPAAAFASGHDLAGNGGYLAP